MSNYGYYPPDSAWAGLVRATRGLELIGGSWGDPDTPTLKAHTDGLEALAERFELQGQQERDLSRLLRVVARLLLRLGRNPEQNTDAADDIPF
jgi:hypothetical protein